MAGENGWTLHVQGRSQIADMRPIWPRPITALQTVTGGSSGNSTLTRAKAGCGRTRESLSPPPRKKRRVKMPAPRTDLSGRKFGRLTVLGFHEVRNKDLYWWCTCECTPGVRLSVRGKRMT